MLSTDELIEKYIMEDWSIAQLATENHTTVKDIKHLLNQKEIPTSAQGRAHAKKIRVLARKIGTDFIQDWTKTGYSKEYLARKYKMTLDELTELCLFLDLFCSCEVDRVNYYLSQTICQELQSGSTIEFIHRKYHIDLDYLYRYIMGDIDNNFEIKITSHLPDFKLKSILSDYFKTANLNKVLQKYNLSQAVFVAECRYIPEDSDQSIASMKKWALCFFDYGLEKYVRPFVRDDFNLQTLIEINPNLSMVPMVMTCIKYCFRDFPKTKTSQTKLLFNKCMENNNLYQLYVCISEIRKRYPKINLEALYPRIIISGNLTTDEDAFIVVPNYLFNLRKKLRGDVWHFTLKRCLDALDLDMKLPDWIHVEEEQ